MAIALDTVGTYSNSGTVSNPSNTFNNVAGNFLVVGFFYGSNASITAATYNGVAMTHVSTTTMTGWVYKVSMYYLPLPATGSHSIAFTLNTASNQATIIQGISYSGVDTLSPVDSTATPLYSVSSGNTQQITLTPTTSTGWLCGWFTNSNSGTVSGGTNTTLRGVTQPQWGFVDTNGTIASGSQTLNLSFSQANFTTEGAVFQGISFKSPAPVVNKGAFFTFM